MYQQIYGFKEEDRPTLLTDAMDTARGGYFTEDDDEYPPNPYPEGAWYTYNDEGCTYNCMASEYFYWVLSSVLNAQYVDSSGDCHAKGEWNACTYEAVQSTDVKGFDLFAGNPRTLLPTTIP